MKTVQNFRNSQYLALNNGLVAVRYSSPTKYAVSAPRLAAAAWQVLRIMTAQSTLGGRRVLVTGARGFIGSHLCDRLVREGAEVHGVSSASVKRGEMQHWWRSDLLDLADVKKLLDEVRPDVVFHLSGHVSAAPRIENVLLTFHSLLTSTVNLLTLCCDVGCPKVVLTGSLTEPPPGSADSVPSSPYGAAKWMGAAYGRMFHLLYRLPVVIARPFMVYGPRQNPSKVIPYTISSLAQGVVPKLSSGDWAADWIYITDVIEGMIGAATAGGLEGCTVDFGCGKVIPLKEVVHRIVTIMGAAVGPIFGELPNRPAEVLRVADVEYTHAKLGWKPTVSLDEGLAATVRSITNQVEMKAR